MLYTGFLTENETSEMTVQNCKLVYFVAMSINRPLNDQAVE